MESIYLIKLEETESHGIRTTILKDNKEIGNYYQKFNHTGERCTVNNITVKQVKKSIKSFNKSIPSKFLCVREDDILKFV